MNNKMMMAVCAALFSLSAMSAWAQAPVVDLTEQGDAAIQAPSNVPTVHAVQGEAVAESDINADSGDHGSSPSNGDNDSQNNQPMDDNPPPMQQFNSVPDTEAVAPPTTMSVPEQSNLTVGQRFVRLQQQVSNLTAMNLPQQLNDLQQQIAQLRGQLQVQAHDLKMLDNQQRSFYQDLNKRIDQMQNLTGNGNGHDNGGTNQNNGDSNNTTKNKDDNASSSSSDHHSHAPLKDASAYQAAFKLMAAKQYQQAQTAFTHYLQHYPHGHYVAGAHYWLGEIFLALRNPSQAANEFNTVIEQFPQSEKLADAQLKLAVIHAEMGKTKTARRELQAIKRQHPGSTAAQLASIRLQQLNEQP